MMKSLAAGVLRLPTRVVLLAILVELWPAAQRAGAGAAPWEDQRRFGPVVCRADFVLAGYEGLFREVADVQRELQRTLGIAPAREPIEVYLFRDEGTYARHFQGRFPKVAYRRAMYVKSSGPGQVFVFRGKELPVDLRHESTHAFLHAALPAVPLWLDEGLAEYFEVSADKRVFDNPYLSLSFKTEVQFGKAPRLALLEARRDLSDMSAVDYRNAWAWVHFLLHGPPEAREELVRYVAELGAGRAPGELGPRLAQRLPDVEQCFVRHFRAWQRSLR
jgi:hypothetical protein